MKDMGEVPSMELKEIGFKDRASRPIQPQVIGTATL